MRAPVHASELTGAIRRRMTRVARIAVTVSMVAGLMSGIVVALTTTTAAAAQALTCIDPASGGTAATFVVGTAATYLVECEEETGTSGTAAYPAVTVATDTLPADGNPTFSAPYTSGGSLPVNCTQTTSGSGATEFYITECDLSDTPTPADTSGSPYTATFTATPGAFSGSTLTTITSGTLTVTAAAATVSCIDPASGGTSATFAEGTAAEYNVECEDQSGISGVTAYPQSININTGSFPADAGQAFPTTYTTGTAPGSCTHGTSGSGATEEYILECELQATPTSADQSPPTYPFTFTATGPGGDGTVTSGTLTVTVSAPTVTCIDPASGGTAATFIEGTAAEYTVECESVSGISGVTAYPQSINISTGSFPADASQAFPTTYTTGTAPGSCTHATSGSGATEDYLLECELQATPTSADQSPPTYPFKFTATGPGGYGTTTSGTLTVTVSAPTVTCIDPASGGTAATFQEGTAAEYTVECESVSGISGVTAYPQSINISTGSFPADASQAFPTTYTTGTAPGSCTHATSGSGATEDYLLECELQATPTSADQSPPTYPFKFTATGPGGYGTTTSGTLTVTVSAPTVSCIDPASGGSSTTFYSSAGGSANSYTVECEAQSGISGVSAYPSSIAIATQSPALPADVTFGSGCTTGTSGSGATEEYILECPLAENSVTADDGTYAVTFSAVGPGGYGSATSGTLTLTVAPPVTTCTLPASGGTTESWVVGTAESVTLNCYSEGFAASDPGNYPVSITVATGALPADAADPTTTGQGCTQATTGSGTSTEYELQCKITETPTYSDKGSYHATFLVTAGSTGAPNANSGTLTINITQPAPTWTAGTYYSAIRNVPFCDNVAVSNAAALPLTSMSVGVAPAGFTNYTMPAATINLAAGTAQVCGTDTNAPASSGTPPNLAPVATNSGGSTTASIPIGSQPECTWVASQGTVSMFDPNQDLEQAGSQSAFGQPITNGETLGTTTNYPTCTADVMEDQDGSLGGAWTVNTANPLPTPTDTNGSASQGDLGSSNLELGQANASPAVPGGCYGTTVLLSAEAYTTLGTKYLLTVPSPWVNGGDCAYGSLGSNSAGGNTDTINATCPPSQADVNEGYVDCTTIASSGNDATPGGSFNYTTLDLFFNGQPVPQQSTAALSTSAAVGGQTVTVTGGTNWWGSSGARRTSAHMVTTTQEPCTRCLPRESSSARTEPTLCRWSTRP